MAHCSTGEVRLSWRELLEEAVSKPGTVQEAYSRFWNYSFGNQILALAQCRTRGIEPGPLASFNRWRELGRRVKKGEKALTLCMPIRIKCREWDERRREAGLEPDTVQEDLGSRTVFVFKRNWFVLAQTEGQPYTAPACPAWSRQAALAQLGIREEPFIMTDGNCQGYATTGTIAVSPLAALPWKTTFHEVAHVLLGHVGQGRLTDEEVPSPALREVEAESVALICCESLGLPGSECCRGYIQHWIGGDKIPDRSAQRIFTAADRIIRAGLPSVDPMLVNKAAHRSNALERT